MYFRDPILGTEINYTPKELAKAIWLVEERLDGTYRGCIDKSCFTSPQEMAKAFFAVLQAAKHFNAENEAKVDG